MLRITQGLSHQAVRYNVSSIFTNMQLYIHVHTGSLDPFPKGMNVHQPTASPSRFGQAREAGRDAQAGRGPRTHSDSWRAQERDLDSRSLFAGLELYLNP